MEAWLKRCRRAPDSVCELHFLWDLGVWGLLMSRRGVSIVLLAIMCIVALAAAACGGQTVAAPPSSTETTASANAEAAETVRAVQEYKEAITGWVQTYMVPAETQSEKLVFVDPLRPTRAEIERAREFAAYLRTALAALREISAPAEVADAHSQFCTSFNGELTALDRMITGIEGESERDIELAFRMWEEALALEERALSGLSPYVDLKNMIDN